MRTIRTNHPEIDFMGLFTSNGEFIGGFGLTRDTYQETLSRWVQHQMKANMGNVDVMNIPAQDFESSLRSQLSQVPLTNFGTSILASELVYYTTEDVGLLVSGKVLNFSEPLFARLKSAIALSRSPFSR